MEQLLCYFPDPGDPACAAVRRAALLQKIRLRAAAPEQAGQKLGFLLGRKGYEPVDSEAAAAVPDPILVLDGFTGARMDALLRSLAKTGVPRTVFKAVVTAANVDWTLYALWQELKQERAALERGEEPVHGR